MAKVLDQRAADHAAYKLKREAQAKAEAEVVLVDVLRPINIDGTTIRPINHGNGKVTPVQAAIPRERALAYGDLYVRVIRPASCHDRQACLKAHAEGRDWAAPQKDETK